MGNIINKETETEKNENVDMCELLQDGKIKVISSLQRKGQNYHMNFLSVDTLLQLFCKPLSPLYQYCMARHY